MGGVVSNQFQCFYFPKSLENFAEALMKFVDWIVDWGKLYVNNFYILFISFLIKIYLLFI